MLLHRLLLPVRHGIATALIALWLLPLLPVNGGAPLLRACEMAGGSAARTVACSCPSMRMQPGKPCCCHPAGKASLKECTFRPTCGGEVPAEPASSGGVWRTALVPERLSAGPGPERTPLEAPVPLRVIDIPISRAVSPLYPPPRLL